MDLDASCGDETEYLVTIDRVAALGQFIFDAGQVLVDHQYVLVGRAFLDGGCRAVFLGAACLRTVVWLGLLAYGLYIFIDYLVRIQPFFGDFDIEVGHGLETFLLDVAHHCRLVRLNLPVLEASLQHLLGELYRFHGFLFQCLLDFHARFRGDDKTQPVPFRALL